MAVSRATEAKTFTGLSSDTKPQGVPVGSTFYETDSLRTYVYNGTSWSVMP